MKDSWKIQWPHVVTPTLKWNDVKWAFQSLRSTKKNRQTPHFFPNAPGVRWRQPTTTETLRDHEFKDAWWMMKCGLSMFEPSAKTCSLDYIDLSLACHFYTGVTANCKMMMMMMMMVIVELGLVMMPYLVAQVNTGWNPATKGTKDVYLGADFWGTNVPATSAPMANREASWVVSRKARKSSEHQISRCNMELDSRQRSAPNWARDIRAFNAHLRTWNRIFCLQNAQMHKRLGASWSLTHRLCRPKPTKWSNLTTRIVRIEGSIWNIFAVHWKGCSPCAPDIHQWHI